MSMWMQVPVAAQSGYSMPQQPIPPRKPSSAYPKKAPEKKKKSAKFKNLFLKGPSLIRRKSKDVDRRDSFASTAFALESDDIPGDVLDQAQSLFFARLPLEVRLQIYEEVIGRHIYHFRTSRGVANFICPGGYGGECKQGHPWGLRPLPLTASSAQEQPLQETRTALLQTCRLMYIETFELLYKRARFSMSGLDPLLALAKTIQDAGLRRITFVELRAPDLLVWQVKIGHPHKNRQGFAQLREAAAVLKRMESLRSLYIIVPNLYSSFGRAMKHKVSVERDLLSYFTELQPISDFRVWLAWYDDEGYGYRRGDEEAKRYPFTLVRYPASVFWPLCVEHERALANALTNEPTSDPTDDS